MHVVFLYVYLLQITMQVVVFKHNYMNINNKDIIQSYIMTTAKYDFSADEKRILLRLVETWQHLLEGKELNGKIERDLFGGYILEFPISYFVPDNQTNYKRIKDALRSLNDKKFEYEDEDMWEIIRIIERPQIRKRKKVVFELNEKIVECFLNFTKGYRKFELETALSFSSVYAVRFYELGIFFKTMRSPRAFSKARVNTSSSI